MKLCEAVLLAALLVCDYPRMTVEYSDELPDDVLESLDLKRVPRTSKEKFAVPRYMMALYSSRVRTGPLRRKNPEIIRTFFREGKHEPVGSHHHFLFNISAINPKEKIKRAELRIFKRRLEPLDRPHGSFLVSVASLLRPWNPETAAILLERDIKVFTSKVVQNKRKGEWIIYDVTSSVKHWNNRSAKNFGVVVSIHGMGVNSSSFKMGNKERREPFLVTFSDATQKHAQRTRRGRDEGRPRAALNDDDPPAALDEDIGNETTTGAAAVTNRRMARSVQSRHCKKHPLKVQFKVLHWKSWIISPRSYSAYYCQGRCPRTLHDYFNPTNHAILQNILHHRLDRNIPCASCVPIKLHCISVLFYNDDKTISLRELGDMVVSTCGCL